MTAIAIPETLRAAICAHARATFPEECCGYLRGARDGATVDAAITCTNAQASGDHPIAPERTAESGFVISGPELFAFARSFDTALPARIVYHSHTNGRANFSDVDQAVAAGPAYPVQHVVIGVTADRIAEVAQFAWSTADNAFVEVARW